MRYRRNRIRGGTYFLTLTLADRRSALLVEQIDILRDALRYVRTRHPFVLEAVAVLPDHLHLLITLPPGDDEYQKRIMLLKQYFSRHVAKSDVPAPSRLRKGERQIWQRRYWEHTVRDDGDFSRCMDYIHMNPVKHGHVRRAADWPYSSLPRYIRAGIYPPDWMNIGDFGALGEFDV